MWPGIAALETRNPKSYVYAVFSKVRTPPDEEGHSRIAHVPFAVGVMEPEDAKEIAELIA